LDGEAPVQLVTRVSQAKARAVTDVRPDELVVAADTIVVLDGSVLGKPNGSEEAAAMLRHLRGRAHTVLSGVAVWHPDTRRMRRELGESTVWMREYTDDEIASYVASGDPLDKAGAYAIQHPEFDPVSEVEGCWLSVMGLPLCHLGRALGEFGVTLPAHIQSTCSAFNQRECTAWTAILGG
jgi:septum formation protein